MKECKVKNQKNIKLDEDKQIGYAMPLEILDPLVRILKLQSIETHDAELVAEEQQAQLEIREAFAELEATVEQMKCCGNCTRFMIDDHHALYCENDVYPFPIFGKCDKWEGR